MFSKYFKCSHNACKTVEFWTAKAAVKVEGRGRGTFFCVLCVCVGEGGEPQTTETQVCEDTQPYACYEPRVVVDGLGACVCTFDP